MFPERAGSAAQSREQRNESKEYSSSNAWQRVQLSEATDTAILKVSNCSASQQVVQVLRPLSSAAHAAGQDMLKQQQLCPCLQTMLAMEDTGALLRFVQRPNRVALSEGEAALRAAGRYSELVALYQERDQSEGSIFVLSGQIKMSTSVAAHLVHAKGFIRCRGPYSSECHA